MDNIADCSPSTAPLDGSSVIEGQPGAARGMDVEEAVNVDETINNAEFAAVQLNVSSANSCANPEYPKGSHSDSTDNNMPATFITILPETFSLEDTATLYFAGGHFHGGGLHHQSHSTNVSSYSIQLSASGSLGDQERRDESSGIAPSPEGNLTSD